MAENIIVTQARLNSSRLPLKVLKRINGETLLETHLYRLNKSVKIQKVILATTFENGIEQVLEIGKRFDVETFQGETNNVLSRFYFAAKKYNPKYVVRVTSDCPLIDPYIIDTLLEIIEKENLDYISNTMLVSFPDGQDVEVIKFKALETCYKMATLISDIEHVTPFIIRNSSFMGGDLFLSKNYESKTDYSRVRMTVDEKSDFEAIKILIKKIGKEKKWVDYANFIINNQNLFNNQKILRNEGYLNSLKKNY